MIRVLAFVGKCSEFCLLLGSGSSCGVCWTNGSSFVFGGSSVSLYHSDIIRFNEDIMKNKFSPINVNIKIGDGAFLDLRVIHSVLIFFPNDTCSRWYISIITFSLNGESGEDRGCFCILSHFEKRPLFSVLLSLSNNNILVNKGSNTQIFHYPFVVFHWILNYISSNDFEV